MQATLILLAICAQGGYGRTVGGNSDAREASEVRTARKALFQSLLAIRPTISKGHDLNVPANPRRAGSQIKMQSVKQLRERSESVSKSKQITEAMRLVAAARVKKSHRCNSFVKAVHRRNSKGFGRFG
jgi:hypothetical protein